MIRKLLRQATVTCFFVSYICAGSNAGELGQQNFPKCLNQSEWTLVWQDDFSGKTIDDTKWEHCPEWVRGEGQCQWSKQDANVDGEGNLRLRIRKSDGRIHSGAVRTASLFTKRFGYFEIRCKVPVIEGGWCAFWMMPAQGNHPGDEGRDGTEIDIFESIGADKGQVNHALHWDGYRSEHKKEVRSMDGRSDLYEGYHTFAMRWNEKEYIFYIDDRETWRSSAGGVMQVPAYLKISIEAAKWSGDIHKEELPKFMVVDYVRVYDRKTPSGQTSARP